MMAPGKNAGSAALGLSVLDTESALFELERVGLIDSQPHGLRQ